MLACNSQKGILSCQPACSSDSLARSAASSLTAAGAAKQHHCSPPDSHIIKGIPSRLPKARHGSERLPHQGIAQSQLKDDAQCWCHLDLQASRPLGPTGRVSPPMHPGCSGPWAQSSWHTLGSFRFRSSSSNVASELLLSRPGWLGKHSAIAWVMALRLAEKTAARPEELRQLWLALQICCLLCSMVQGPTVQPRYSLGSPGWPVCSALCACSRCANPPRAILIRGRSCGHPRPKAYRQSQKRAQQAGPAQSRWLYIFERDAELCGDVGPFQ